MFKVSVIFIILSLTLTLKIIMMRKVMMHHVLEQEDVILHNTPNGLKAD